MAGYQPYMPPSTLVQQPMGAPQYVPQVPIAPAYIPMAPQPPPPPPYMQTAQQPQQFRPNPWTPSAPQAPQVPQFRPSMPVSQPQYQPQQQQATATAFHVQGLPYSKFGYYGYVPDNMWSALASVPPPWRPQQAGETFGRRVVVNTVLRMVEILLQELVIAVRQMLFPPLLNVPPIPAR